MHKYIFRGRIHNFTSSKNIKHATSKISLSKERDLKENSTWMSKIVERDLINNKMQGWEHSQFPIEIPNKKKRFRFRWQ